MLKDMSKKSFLVSIDMAGVIKADPRMEESRKVFVSASAGRMEIFLNV